MLTNGEERFWRHDEARDQKVAQEFLDFLAINSYILYCLSCGMELENKTSCIFCGEKNLITLADRQGIEYVEMEKQ